MSSRAWTEVATGAEARSIRRWAARRASPILVNYLVLLLLLILAGLAFADLFVAQTISPRDRPCYPTLNGNFQCATDPAGFSDLP